MNSNLDLLPSLRHIKSILTSVDALLTIGKTKEGHAIVKSLLRNTTELLDGLALTDAAPPLLPTFPASCIVHTPNGRTPACEKHAEQLEAVFRCMGGHTNRTPLEEPKPCSNCINETQNKTEDGP